MPVLYIYIGFIAILLALGGIASLDFKKIKSLRKSSCVWKCPVCGKVNLAETVVECACGYAFKKKNFVNSGLEIIVCDSCFEANNPDASSCKLCKASLEPAKSRRYIALSPIHAQQTVDPESPYDLRLEFRGCAREYFRIWIVNLCLTLLTAGIFSAWAKVRKKRYFYSCLRLDGTPFQYLGQPGPILKGRVIAAIAFSIYYLSSHFFTSLLPYVLIAGAVFAPWVIVRSASFNARYSAFRNSTFSFGGKYIDAAKVLYAWGIVPAFVIGTFFGQLWGGFKVAGVVTIIFGLAFPWWIRRLKKFLVDSTSYGGKKGILSATGGQFFKIYFVAGCIVLAIGIVGVIFAIPISKSIQKSSPFNFILFVLPFYFAYVLAYAYVQAHSSNLVWNETRLGPLFFQSTMRTSGMAKLYITNALAIILSLGLLIPWAVMRTLKYRADNMQIKFATVDGAFSEFHADRTDAVQAVGAELGDFFDMDVSL